MADVCDHADKMTQVHLQAQLQNIRNQRSGIAPMGYCHNCDEPFPADSKKLFCDSECATDWEKLNQK